MFGHTVFSRTSALFSNKLVLTHRISHVNVTAPWRELRRDTKLLSDDYQIPEKPKRPLTSYFRFMLERRPIVLKENPSFPNREIIRQISEQWKSLSAVDRVKYEESALEDKEKYEEELLKYNAKLTPEQEDILNEIKATKREMKKKRRIRRENKVMGKPKQPLTSFGRFFQESVSKAKPGIYHLSDALLKWKEMSEVEKEKYQIAYQRNKEKYEIELANWEASMITQGKSYLVRAKALVEHGFSNKGDKLKQKKKTKENKKSK